MSQNTSQLSTIKKLQTTVDISSLGKKILATVILLFTIFCNRNLRKKQILQHLLLMI